MDSSQFIHFQDLCYVEWALGCAVENETFLSQENRPPSNEIEEELFVVGPDELLTTQALGGSRIIRCHTFLSLGRIEVDSLQIFAKNVVLANCIHATHELIIESKSPILVMKLHGCDQIRTAQMVIEAKAPPLRIPRVIHRPVLNEFADVLVLGMGIQIEWIEENPMVTTVRAIGYLLKRELFAEAGITLPLEGDEASS